jgi:hypothetical protein
VFVRRGRSLLIVGLIALLLAQTGRVETIAPAFAASSPSTATQEQAANEDVDRALAALRTQKTDPVPAAGARPDASKSPAPSPSAVPPPGVVPQFAPDCPPNDNNPSLPPRSDQRCIAEVVTGTREHLGYAWNPGAGAPTGIPCMKDPRALVPNAKYKIKDCRAWGKQAENLAQNRIIAQLNAAGVHGDTSLTGITPNLQWEVTVPGTRGQQIDLLM